MNLKEKILVISIALVFVFFVHYGLNTFYKEPKYENYCNSSSFYHYPEEKTMATPMPTAQPSKGIDYSTLSCGNITTEQLCRRLYEQSACDQVSQQQRAEEQRCYNQKGQPTYNVNEKGCNVYRDCNFCNKDFQDSLEKYNRVIFIAAGIIGIATLIVGAASLALESVGAGLMGGGVITILYGTIRYWGNLPDVGRFVVLGIALVILIWLGYKKLASGSQVQQKKAKKR